MQITKINSVSETETSNVYLVNCTGNIGEGEEVFDYVLSPTDQYGLAPVVRAAVEDWIAGEKPIQPYVAPVPIAPSSVSARQFKLQLLAAGFLVQVENWIAAQDPAIQIAYANSGSFVRSEPMMQAGFDALGFTSEQIDAFYTAAAAL